jgi:hypothetical protein
VSRALFVALALFATACASSTAVTTIRSEPDGARVYVDGDYRGETPLTIELEKRTHRVRLEKEGFEPRTSHVSVKTNDDPLVFWFIGQIATLGMYDDKYGFEESYTYPLAPVSPE